MSSRFKESLGLIKYLREECLYHTDNEEGFCEKYVECPDNIELLLKDDIVIDGVSFSTQKYSPLNFFCDTLYGAFLFISEIENILDQIEYCGLNFRHAESLMDTCSLLFVTSSSVMISLDESCFQMTKKYSLAEDIYIIAKNMYDDMMRLNLIVENIDQV